MTQNSNYSFLSSRDSEYNCKSFEDSSTSWNFLFLSYLDPLLHTANTERTIELEDLGCCSLQDLCSTHYDAFDRNWNHKLTNSDKADVSLNKILWKSIGYSKLFRGVALYVVYTVGSLIPVVILNILVKHFEGVDRKSQHVLWILVFAMFFLPTIATCFCAHSNIIFAHCALQFRNTLISKIYRKVMILSPASKQGTSTGEIVNIFSTDTRTISGFLFVINQFVMALPTILISLYLIHSVVGSAVFSAIAMVAVGFPINVGAMNFIKNCRKQKLSKSDMRTKLMNEILNGIRIIKYYGWESAFEQKVLAIREEELRFIKRIAYTIAVFFTISLQGVPVFLPVVTFYTFVKLGGDLTTATAFTVLGYMNIMSFPFIFLPLGLTNYSNMLVSSARITKFLTLPEQDKYVREVVYSNDSSKQDNENVSAESIPLTHHNNGTTIAIRFRDAQLGWLSVPSQNTVSATATEKSQVNTQRSSTLEHGAGSRSSDGNGGDGIVWSSVRAAWNGHGRRGDYEQLVFQPEDEEEEEKEEEKGVEAAATIEVCTNAAETETFNPSSKHQLQTQRDSDDTMIELVAVRDSARRNSTASGTIADDTCSRPHISKLSQHLHQHHHLHGINLEVCRGQLVAVVGAVGAGKSSLLSALLGDMNLMSGSVEVSGTIAYCDQKPWIINDTIKANIEIGRRAKNLVGNNNTQSSPRGSDSVAVDVAMLNTALRVTDLEQDVQALPSGIRTQIGERGVTLSGGQKARLALARAVYSDADICLLDDPLSAVDAYVGQLLFDECIAGLLRATGKTVVLVTHHVHLLPRCDKIVVLQEGGILFEGSFGELQLRPDIDVNALLERQSEQSSVNEKIAIDHHLQSQQQTSQKMKQQQCTEEIGQKIVSKQHLPYSTGRGSNSYASAGSVNEIMATATVAAAPVAVTASIRPEEHTVPIIVSASRASSAVIRKQVGGGSGGGGELMTKEERNEGSVSSSTYLVYCRAGGIAVFGALIAFAFLVQLFSMSGSFWLVHWGAESAAQHGGHGLSTRQNLCYLNIFACFGAASICSYSLRAICNANHRVAAARNLHQNVLHSVLNCPISFFDTTPIGRILSRFSQDLATVDEELAMTIIQTSNGVSQCVFAVIAVICATKGAFIAFLGPLVWLYRDIERRYRRTNTAVARLESVSRSPIYADFNQMLAGMASVKAYKLQDAFIERMQGRVDSNTIAMITGMQLSNWLAIRLDLMSAAISFFVAVLAILTENSGFISPGFLGLGLVYSFQLTTYLKYFIKTNGALEAQMNAVERLQYYSTQLPQEKVEGASSLSEFPCDVPDNWPNRGTVIAKNISLKYRDGPMILKDVSFAIDEKQKIGIAGRTGSGKSSLLVALFRIEELSGGSITIDGLDIRTVPLHVLRSRLGIIPQEAVMFSETVRFNLDPFAKYSDADVWEVLKRVNMKAYVEKLPLKLQDRVSEGGENFSAGQRQLICIARALLRRSKLLVLDEATANVDNETDVIIQRMVRQQFVDSTVLTIAHRLHTIIDSDRIIVLNEGQLIEMDTPDNLLRSESTDPNASQCDEACAVTPPLLNEDDREQIVVLCGSPDSSSVQKNRRMFKALWDQHQSSHNKT